MELLACAFDSRCTFGFQRCLFKFDGRDFAFHPGDDDRCEVIQTVLMDSSERDEAFELINKFLFRFAWENHCSFHFVGTVGQGFSKPIALIAVDPILIVHRNYRNLLVDFCRLAVPTSDEVEIALSLFNEARYSNDCFHRFVCYWKILSIKPPNGRKSKPENWINRVLKARTDLRETNHLRSLISSEPDVGLYFKEECRNAIFQTERPPTLISYKWDNYSRIENACAAIEPFVEYFIEHELGMPRRPGQIEVIEAITDEATEKQQE